MSRSGPTILVTFAAALLFFAALADHALSQRADRERQRVQRLSEEQERLVPRSVRASLAEIEQAVVAGRTVPGVVWRRLVVPPARHIATGRTVPYARRPREELVALLDSTAATASGLPEAVVARLALGDQALGLGNTGPGPDVAERLLEGALPVRPDDLPFLARSLGHGDDPRVARLQQRLRALPVVVDLPTLPGFRRRVQGDVIDGWSRGDRTLWHYRLNLADLLARAGVADRARRVAPGGAALSVLDVEGLGLAVETEQASPLLLTAPRVALWLTAVALVAGLFVVARAQAQETQAVAREKAFLGAVTHELRTPLASIRLLGDTLAQGRGDAREYGALLARESERLEGLVERVLAVTRVDAAPTFARLQPAELVHSTVTLMRPRAERRGVTLRCSVSDGLPEVVWDGDAVRRALLNLLDNAVTHGHSGGRVDVRAHGNGTAVHLTVADDGPGIAARHRQDVFRRFGRGKTDAPGLGLGLHLVEQVARAHGGRVDLTTAEGRGSAFTLVLPRHPAAAS